MELTADQQQFKEVVDRFLTDRSAPEQVRAMMATELGYDQTVWQQLSGEVGLTGTHLPEAYGGFGFGPVELAIVAQEMGRHLYCGPFFASAVMAAHAILLFGTEAAKSEQLPLISSGTTIAALVLDNLADPAQVGQLISADSAARLQGEAPLVVDAQAADLLVVVARSTSGLGLYTVAADADGVGIEQKQSMDATRKLCSVSFGDVQATAIHSGSVDLHPLWDQMSIVLANEMVGGAERLFTSTIDYMKMRVQFGRAIGSFQALKHRCADLLLELELAKATAFDAAVGWASGQGQAHAANMAKALASDVYMNIAKAAIQLRGGIGFTWEEDTHLWYKRAKSSEVFLGSAQWHRERMICHIEQQWQQEAG